ncbi:MAG: hypothetical protein IKR34_06410 [Candidatus Gastranaerophilales bacterium]|nr:hypothetical protein [Candidatus Gastranaerophilales bacterium]
MINSPKIDNRALKIQAAKQTYSKQIVPKKIKINLHSTYAKQDFSFKVLAYQVLALAEQDNMNPVGQKFNIRT